MVTHEDCNFCRLRLQSGVDRIDGLAIISSRTVNYWDHILGIASLVLF